MILGAACLIVATACFVLVFSAFRGASASRNYQVFVAWGTTLLFAGSLLSLPSLAIAICLGLAAVAATLLGARLNGSRCMYMAFCC